MNFGNFIHLKIKQMKKIIIIPIIILFLPACGQVKNNENTNNNNYHTAANENKVFVYRFQNKFLDLESLKYIDTNMIKTFYEIKKESIHANMFSKDPICNKVIFKKNIFELTENRDINIYDGKGKLIKTISDPDKKIPSDNISGNSVIFSVASGVIVIIRLEGENGYQIKKYDENGNIKGTWKIPHTIIEKKGNVFESIPYLYYFAHTDDAIIFSSIYYGKPSGSIILNLYDSTQIKCDQPVGGIIVKSEDNTLAGTISLSDKSLEIKMHTKNWKIVDKGSGDAAKTVLSDSILVVARYHNIATGCQVKAYNINTGNLVWIGDVKQLNVDHSKYYNIVHITLYKDKLILEGNEAFGNYLQLLDLKTGKNLFADMPDNK